MVKLRLARYGKKHRPHFRLVVMPARSKRNGEPIEFLGHYDPMDKPENAKFDLDRVKHWLSVGAKPTDTVHRLLARQGVLEELPSNFNKKPGRKAQERAEAAKAEAEAKADTDKEEKDSAE
jgi:small subunit ribosomal protein S16